MNNIIIIGAGNMGRALAKGFLRNPDTVIYFKTKHNSPQTHCDFENNTRVSFHTDNDFFKNIKNPWIILCVKPYSICSVITDICDILNTTSPKALISVAAGIDTATIRATVPNNIPIIRTMPNISVATGQGVMGYFATTEKSEIIYEFMRLCMCLGDIYPLEHEDDFHLFTAIAGSSPAFFLHFIEAIAQAADNLGIDYTQAEKIATQVFIGTASLLQEKHTAPKILRESVTSPNGTTQAGLEVLINTDLNIKQSILGALLQNTLQASTAKSKVIAENLKV